MVHVAEGHLFGAPRQVAGRSDARPLKDAFVHNMPCGLETKRHPLGWRLFFVACRHFFGIAVAVVVNRLVSESAEKVSPTCNIAIDSDGICCQAPETQP